MTEENKPGKKITSLREAHHLSIKDLADRCSCDVDVIEQLEAGEVPPISCSSYQIDSRTGCAPRNAYG